MNLALIDLQRIILNKRDEPLSTIEIKNLFSYPTTPEFILYIITSLNRKKIDPNTVLLQAISNATKKEDMLSVALALRYGADPNLYVNTPEIGDIHILGYTYLVLSKRELPVLNSVVIMLMEMGSSPSMGIFDAKGGIIKDEFSLLDPVKGRSVIDWLDALGYDTIIPQIRTNYDAVNSEFITTLGTFLDKKDMLRENPLLDNIISSHDINITKPSSELCVCIYYLNLKSYKKYVNEGVLLKYEQINDIILSVGKYNKNDDVISAGQLREMLIYSVARGTEIDTYQEEMLKQTQIYNIVKKSYELPYWQKVCKVTKGEVSDKLKRLAYSLNLYPEYPKDTLCHQIREISQADPEKVKKSAIERQRSRIMTDVSRINQFDDKPPTILCRNRSLVENVYDYPDSEVSFYKDPDDALWCFISPNYDKILSTKVNPYTDVAFPDFFINDVIKNKSTVSKYTDGTPVPISKSIDKLSQNDTINNSKVDKYKKLFDEMAALNGVSDWNINKLTNEDLQEILLNTLDINTNLKDLTREHAIKTFSFVSYRELLNNLETTEDFFEQVETKSLN